ncbi:cupin domain-containing protein [Pseudoduganella ginsengisoli]|uniref:Cupin domain-containing protein n=1 Tax=Pseudoduganella ginsengisoli TaxID=1462440 RepID=A0A6L6PYH6_9BURK|nr:cupin domain-containing protein [Pseudoduganella ginsengisoli]MTW02219.1 cupin domain-containing protein [Pseudoduganella ginsengisoli]
MPGPAVGNLLADAAPPAQGERFDVLLSHKGLVIERIVSTSKIASQPYVQEQDEWVVLLKGSATLDVAGGHVALGEGDYLFLPSRTPHTVLTVSDGAMWLAIHLHPGPSV